MVRLDEINSEGPQPASGQAMTFRHAPHSLEPLEHPTPLRLQVHSVLEELIVTGKLKPGQRLVEAELAKQLQVSRGPIREALQMLAREGWVELRPRQGTFVAKPSMEELVDYLNVRSLLEVNSAKLAARAVATRPEDHHESLRTMDDLIVSSRQDRPQQHGQVSERAASAREFHTNWSRPFHRIVAEVSGNIALVDLLERLGRRTQWFFLPGVLTRSDLAWRQHAQIRDAIARGDEAAAAACMDEHMETTLNSFLQSRS